MVFKALPDLFRSFLDRLLTRNHLIRLLVEFIHLWVIGLPELVAAPLGRVISLFFLRMGKLLDLVFRLELIPFVFGILVNRLDPGLNRDRAIIFSLGLLDSGGR